VWPPDPTNAVPAGGKPAAEGLRTIPPRENCGNVDAKQLTKGSRLFIPVNVDGALYSVGDGHFAQGDSECCGTAIEMGATCVVRISHPPWRGGRQAHRPGPASRIRATSRRPRPAMPRNFIAHMGMPITADGRNENCDITLRATQRRHRVSNSCRSAAGRVSRPNVICSVAVDLRVSNVVERAKRDVSALLPEDIFQ